MPVDRAGTGLSPRVQADGVLTHKADFQQAFFEEAISWREGLRMVTGTSPSQNVQRT